MIYIEPSSFLSKRQKTSIILIRCYTSEMKKSRYQKYFKDKNITVMGIGTLGRGVGDIKFLASCGAHITATDLKKEDALKKSLRQLKRFKNISYTLGRHSVQDFRNRDLILKGAGVPLENKYIETARDDAVPVHMSFGLVMDILKQEKLDVTIIGITGTKGKSTTTGLVESVLKTAGINYHLAGNIRGVANLPLLKKVEDGDVILAELDSWQLQGLHTVKMSPDIGIFTNFFEDHLNYYEGSMRSYFKDKSAIFKYQDEHNDVILTHNSAKAIRKYYRGKVTGKRHMARFTKIPKSWEYQIFGKHNESNLAIAYTLGKVLNISQADIKEALTTFSGVEGRFQYLGTKQDILFFNDNNSTTPESTILSLTSLRQRYPEKNIILLGGGADKNFHYQKLAKYIERNVTHSFLFSGNATDKIKACLTDSFERMTETISMKTAFRLALTHARKGDIIILSPGAASFGVFNNEYDRHDQFVRLFKKL